MARSRKHGRSRPAKSGQRVSSSPQQRSNDEPLFEAFLSTLRTHEPFDDARKFGAWIERRHGGPGRALAEAVLDDPIEPPDERFASLGLALDYAFGVRDFELTKSLQWLENQWRHVAKDADRILDVNCDIGLHAIFETLMTESAEVVGVDTDARATALASELAGRFGLTTGLSFREASVEALVAEGSAPFDLVRVSARALFGAVESLDIPPYRDIAGLDEYVRPGPEPFLERLKSLVAPGGRAIFEIELPVAGALLWWARALAASGWAIEWALGNDIMGGGIGEPVEMVCLVATVSDAPLHVASGDVISFLARPHVSLLSSELLLIGPAAEAMLAAMDGKRLLLGVEITVDSETVKVTELFEAGPLLAISRIVGYDNRDLLLESSIAREAVLRLVYLAAEVDAEMMHGSVRAYGDEAERMAVVVKELRARPLSEAQVPDLPGE